MKQSKVEADFFKYFDGVQVANVQLNVAERFATNMRRYMLVICRCGAVIRGDRSVCPDCYKPLER